MSRLENKKNKKNKKNLVVATRNIGGSILENLKSAIQGAEETRQVTLSIAETARRAAEEARQRRESAKALWAEAEDIRKILGEVALLDGFFNKDQQAAVDAARQRLNEILSDKDYKVLKSDITKKAEAKAKAEKEKQNLQTSKEVFEFCNRTLQSEVSVIVNWASEGRLAMGAVRLKGVGFVRKDGKSEPVPTSIKVALVKGTTTPFKEGDEWRAVPQELPPRFHKALVAKGWITAPGTKAVPAPQPASALAEAAPAAKAA